MTRRDKLILAAIVLLALVLRFVYLAQISGLPFFHSHFSDARLYADMAARFLSGESDGRAFVMSPLYPALITVVTYATGNADLWVRVLQCVLGAFLAAGVFGIGRRVFDAASGLAGAFLTAVYPLFIHQDGAFMSDALLTVLLTGLAWQLVRMQSAPSVAKAFTAGLLLGALTVGRAVFGLLLPAWIIFDWWQAARTPTDPGRMRALVLRTTMFAAAWALMLVPSTLYNHHAEGEFIPVTSSYGFNLHAGNNPASGGVYRIPEGVDFADDPGGRRFAERASGRALTSSEVSAFWSGRAWEWIASHPGEWLLGYGRKLLLLVRGEEIEQAAFGPGFVAQEYSTVISMPQRFFGVVVILAAVGMVRGLRLRRPGARLLLMIVCVVFAGTAFFFVNGRFRVPVTPLLIVFSGAGVLAYFREGKTKVWREWAPYGFAFAAGMMVTNVLQPDLVNTYEQDYNRLGQAAFDAGDYPTARGYFERSLREHKNVQAMVNLGNALAVLGDRRGAGERYEHAIAMDSTSHLAYYNLGNLALQSGEPRAAYTLWRRALACEPGFIPAHRNLALLLARAGRTDEAREHFLAWRSAESSAAVRQEIDQDIRMLNSAARDTSAARAAAHAP